MSFYYRYPVAELVWNEPCSCIIFKLKQFLTSLVTQSSLSVFHSWYENCVMICLVNWELYSLPRGLSSSFFRSKFIWIFLILLFHRLILAVASLLFKGHIKWKEMFSEHRNLLLETAFVVFETILRSHV